MSISALRYNRTKIVCTIGPATSEKEMLLKLIRSGMDVARLNFSHSKYEEHLSVIQKIREINTELDENIAILLDLQGPKIRIGLLEKPFPIKKEDILYISTSITEQKDNILPIQYETFAKDVNPGDMVLVDDGKIELTVLETNKIDLVKLIVVHGDQINSKKGVNLPFTHISIPALTEKDRKDIVFGIENDVDWMALSFVRTAEEVRELREIIRNKGGRARIIAKIEKPEALTNIIEIIKEADGIMIARGDLGVEIPMEEVPMWQKRIVKLCNQAAKPVIVATQMMESMIENKRPTRAETNDVANAVMDGADALMLSGETSVGRYPCEVVESMAKIIGSMESEEIYYQNMEVDKESSTYFHDAIIITACTLAKQTHAKAIVGMTRSGYTAFQIARCRPHSKIFIFTDNRPLLNTLNLVWGVRAFYYDKFVGTDETILDGHEILKAKGVVDSGDIIINAASMPIQAQERTNMIKIGVVK